MPTISFPKAGSPDESEALGCREPAAAPFALAKGSRKGPSISETGLQEPHGDLRIGAIGGHSRPPLAASSVASLP